jgi:hypothetical protein
MEVATMIPYEERCKTYMNALITYGDRHQMIKCLEEMSECAKEICKILNGGENFDHLAEEIADAMVTLGQMQLIFNNEERVAAYMDAKVLRLDKDLNKKGGLDAEQNYQGKHRQI